MPGPIEATGAQRNPTRYGALTQAGRDITGMWTNRNPLRDAAVPYLVGKFYGGTRFDSIIDGINREISVRMTDRRAPGSIIFNSNTFPAGNSFYPWKYIQSGAEIVRTLYDGQDGNIYDATPGQKTMLVAKAAGAGPARFLGVNTSLFFGDGVETKKILRSGQVWAANASYSPGDFIIDPLTNTIQSVQANPLTFNIATIQVVTLPGALAFTPQVLIVTITGTLPTDLLSQQPVSFAGLTGYVALNGASIPVYPLPPYVQSLLNINPTTQLTFQAPVVGNYGPLADTGTIVLRVDQAGTTGGSLPVFSSVWGTITNDGGNNGGVNWTCLGSPVQNWGVQPLPFANAAYTNAQPALAPITGSQQYMNYWRPRLGINPAQTVAIIDPNGNIQVTTNGTAGVLAAGTTLPSWSGAVGNVTIDGALLWVNYGPIGPWFATGNYGGGSAGVSNICCIVDTNGNLQITTAPLVSAAAGAAPPAWNATIGGNTADGTLNWTNMGGGSVLSSGTIGYAVSFHAVDGSVTTASSTHLVANGILGPSGGYWMTLFMNLNGTSAQTDKQIDQIWLWRTAQGQPTLILLDIIPNPYLFGQVFFEYFDVLNDLALDALIPAPIASTNNPPDPTLTAPVFHMGRIWGILNNTVVNSGGPDTVTGNGNTAFAPLDFIPYPSQPICLIPVTVQNGGLLVLTTDGVWIILGTGTPGNPFYTTLYYSTVSVKGFNAITVYNNQVLLMEACGRVSSLAIEYPFNPQTGYTEIGFPVGDQFQKVTTGGANGNFYNPATAFLSWNVESTDENALYVADGAIGWFRMGIIMPPESGLVWSPRRAIVGGTSAVQSIETSPGQSQLLIAPASSGPILARDDSGTIFTDNGTPYPASWDARGVILLCATGQWVDVAHIATKSLPVGARPIISVLMNELAASGARPWIPLALVSKSNDPPLQPKNLSMFSDRYTLQQNGETIQGDAMTVKFDYGSQAVADELLDWGVFTALHDERAEEAAKAP